MMACVGQKGVKVPQPPATRPLSWASSGIPPMQRALGLPKRLSIQALPLTRGSHVPTSVTVRQSR